MDDHEKTIDRYENYMAIHVKYIGNHVSNMDSCQWMPILLFWRLETEGGSVAGRGPGGKANKFFFASRKKILDFLKTYSEYRITFFTRQLKPTLKNNSQCP
jgi:hypothetical protein